MTSKKHIANFLQSILIIDTFFIIKNIFSIINFQGLVLGNHINFCVLLEYIWLLGTFVNSSCDIKI